MEWTQAIACQRRRSKPGKARAVLLGAATAALALSSAAAAPAAVPEGVWRLDDRAAVQIFDCAGLLCGRIVGLKTPRDLQGAPDKDKHNPDPNLRDRPLCGLVMLWNLHPTEPNHWAGGWFYDPKNGKTYSVAAELKSSDVIMARIYAGSPFFGKTEKLERVPTEDTEGRC